MKKLLFLAVMSVMVFAFVIGCGKKADETKDKAPVETKKAEMMDTTMMDSGMHMMDSTMMDAKDDSHEGHDH